MVVNLSVVQEAHINCQGHCKRISTIRSGACHRNHYYSCNFYYCLFFNCSAFCESLPRGCVLNGFLLKFCCPFGVWEELPVILAVVVVDTVGGVMLTTGVEVATLLTTGVEVGLALLATSVEVGLGLLTIDVEVGLALLATSVEVGLALLATSVEVGLGLLTVDVEVGLSLLSTDVGGDASLVTTGVGLVRVLVPPTIVGGNITWMLISVFVCLMYIRTYCIAFCDYYFERQVLYV